MFTMPRMAITAITLLRLAVALAIFVDGNAVREEFKQNHRQSIDIERILQVLEHNDKKMAAQFNEWKNKTESLVNTLLVKEEEWKERTDKLVKTLIEKDAEWKNRTDNFINTLLEKDAGWKNGTRALVDILQPKESVCTNVTESLVTTILDKESEWVTRSETLIQDTDNLKKLVRGLLFREAESRKKIIALTTMARNLLTFSGVARCEAPFQVIPYVGCIFLDRVGSTWDEGRARCKEMGADIFMASTAKQFLHLSRHYKNNDPGNTDIWVGVKGGIWMNGREPDKEEWIPGDPDDGTAGCGHLESWSRWNNTPRRFLLTDHMCHGKAWTVCHKKP